MTAPANRQYAFSGYRVDALTRELSGPDGAAVPLTSKALDVLLQLIEHRDQFLSKDQLLLAVWPGRVVEENNLTQAVSALRRALGGAAGDHRYIVTVPGRGYRFVAALDEPGTEPVHTTGVAPESAADAPTPAQPAWPRRLRWGALAIALLAATLMATSLWRDRAPPSTVAGHTATIATTVAVLPFRPLGSGNADKGSGDEMLELGMAETLIARLSRSTSMRVLSLGSVQGFTGAKVDPLRAGKTLGAHYVVEGSTQQRGHSIRVNARLLALPDGRTVWAGTYDQAPERVFTLQDDIADAVIAALALQRVSVPAHERSPCDGDDAQAYRAYLRGRYQIHRASGASMLDALAAFRRAIELDPVCTRAYAGMAWAYRGLVNGGDRDPREMFPLAQASAEQALKIDPGSADALVARGIVEHGYHWNWAGAEASFRRAIEINPSLAEARFVYAAHLVSLGRFDEGLVHARQARELDPLSPLINTLEGGFLGAAHQPDEARAQLERALELQPDFPIALRLRGSMALDRGDPRAAIADLKRASEGSQRNSQVVAMLAVAHAAAGERTQAQAILRELEARDTAGYVPPTSLAAVRNALGDTEAALDLLERAYQERDIRLTFLQVDARWNNLRAQPRFRALSRRMGLQVEPVAYGRF